ncbi:MAG: hypothetical protein B7Y80_20775 [Hyphomicrobium sp. 32-62-53]|nr:MAG: hypothetical protein B7Z29_20725 [Hyphomicrobium sp. 12-62-95]OYX97153.1 MAG: hypothetical protein B7Y80_20775 [Hyphomicrobium sp. 32-62-53]
MKTEKIDTTPGTAAIYAVRVDSNARYQDENERYTSGEFATLEEAITTAKRIVLDDLEGMLKPGISARELLDLWWAFGEDPWIAGPGGDVFSAAAYARQLAAAMTTEAAVPKS